MQVQTTYIVYYRGKLQCLYACVYRTDYIRYFIQNLHNNGDVLPGLQVVPETEALKLINERR